MSVSGTHSTEHHESNAVCSQYGSLYRDLKFLKLDNNQIRSLDQCVFAPTSSLQVIDMPAKNLSALDYRILPPLKKVSSFDISCNRLSTVDGQTAQWILETDTAVNLTGTRCVILRTRGGGGGCNVQLLVSSRLCCFLCTDCCTRVAGNPWRCDCGAIYTVYRISREGTGNNITLRCENPAEVRGVSLDILEEKCQPTITPQPPTLPTLTGSAANSGSVNTSPPIQFSTTHQHDVSFQESSPGPSDLHSPSTFLLIFIISFAAAVYIAVVVVSITIRRLRRITGELDCLWWEDVMTRWGLISK
jgi:hypothetical protein